MDTWIIAGFVCMGGVAVATSVVAAIAGSPAHKRRTGYEAGADFGQVDIAELFDAVHAETTAHGSGCAGGGVCSGGGGDGGGGGGCGGGGCGGGGCGGGGCGGGCGG